MKEAFGAFSCCLLIWVAGVFLGVGLQFVKHSLDFASGSLFSEAFGRGVVGKAVPFVSILAEVTVFLTGSWPSEAFLALDGDVVLVFRSRVASF